MPHHFVYNQSHNKNLEILAGHLVKRIIFELRTFSQSPTHHPVTSLPSYLAFVITEVTVLLALSTLRTRITFPRLLGRFSLSVRLVWSSCQVVPSALRFSLNVRVLELKISWRNMALRCSSICLVLETNIKVTPIDRLAL